MKRTGPLLALAILLLGAGTLAAWRVGPRPAPDLVLVDTGADLSRVLRARAAEVQEEEPGPGLLRLPVDEELAARFHPALLEPGGRNVFDPLCYYAPRPHFRATRTFLEHPAGGWEVRTDARGFRRPGEVARERPPLRVLLVGDSHVEGVVPVEETLALRLEAGLRAELEDERVEVLNASRGGYALYNYLGVLERNLDLEPHVFVMVVYGGNDLAGFLPMHLYFRGLELPDAGPGWQQQIDAAVERHTAAFGQAYHQLAYFARAPRAAELALEGAFEVVLEARRIAAANGIRFVCAYLPPAGDVERAVHEPVLARVERLLELTPGDVRATDRLADRLLARLEARGVETLDLRPALRAAAGPVYWRRDHHLSTRGHDVAARALLEQLLSRP